MRQEKPPSTSELLKAFKKMDINNDGYITHNELARVLTQRGEKMTRKEVEAMIAEADDDGDKRLNYNEVEDKFTSVSYQDGFDELSLCIFSLIILSDSSGVSWSSGLLHRIQVLMVDSSVWVRFPVITLVSLSKALKP